MTHDHHSHDHSGHHHHAPTVGRENERLVLGAFAITFGFMVVELVGGLVAGSLALVADAAHMLTDSAALALAWAGFRFGRRGRDARRTFGYMRFEILAGFVNALTLIGLVAWIAWEAVMRLLDPAPVLAGPMLAIAVLGLLVNGGVYWVLSHGDRGHLNIRGAMLHVLGDLLGSVAAIVAAVTIWFTGWTPIDPILSVLLSAIILRSAWSLLRASLNVLMEGSPGNVAVDELRRTLCDRIDGLVRVDHVHVWSITSGQPVATMEIGMEEGKEPADIVRAVKRTLSEEYGIEHSTIEIAWDGRAGPCILDPGVTPQDVEASRDADGHEAEDAVPHPA
ncbi:cobalt-zinc-cadmium efflux system protein [Palleronia aestuarii]|uniref:Cobalt-zinc-cadmium efflux system protein n=1 Tax=Palleronia aestuarii TaxID=568105 RepID=A0A2W7NSF4_9RHOB|nr:cation diffusion facilitator family transporter [Palleronia aestuarii]PZX16206.1 cobalt-zinc-cadmium efflux system protein [Palleronia aestuarii]